MKPRKTLVLSAALRHQATDYPKENHEKSECLKRSKEQNEEGKRKEEEETGNRGKGGKSRGRSRLLVIESDRIMSEKNFPSIG
jgi:hypothetical protein